MLFGKGSVTVNIQGYLDYINTPWGKLFYKLVWRDINFKNKSILDFGSGFGITSNHLAKNNAVTALEPDLNILKYRVADNAYTQIVGSIKKLSAFRDNFFDVIICHNVLEYTDNRTAVLKEFSRLLKPNGVLSLVKHNKAGKVMQKAVFEGNVTAAMSLLHNINSVSGNFGEIKEYSLSDLEEYCGNLFKIENVYGIRTFYGLQDNSVKSNPEWLSGMYDLETAVSQIPDFRNIAFFHHVIMKKK